MVRVPCLAFGMPFSLEALEKPDLLEALYAAISAHPRPGKILVIATVKEAIGVARSLGNRFPDRTIKSEVTSPHQAITASRGVGFERCVWDEDIGTVIVLDEPYRSFFQIRKANALLATSPTYLCPFIDTLSGQGRILPLILPELDFQPIVAIAPPFAGTGRFSPVIVNILEYFGVTEGRVTPYYNNKRMYDPHEGAENLKSLLQKADFNHAESTDKYYSACIKCMKYYSYALIHEFVSPDIVRQCPDVQFLYLMRDPRDLITSLYHRLAFDTHESLFDSIKSMEKDQAIAWLVRGGATIATKRANFKLTIPSLAQTASIFARVAALPNVYIVRYERLLNDPVRVYREILKFLRLDVISLPILAGDLNKMIETGTFKFQSKGRYAEGNNAARSYSDEETTRLSGLRRGVAGDWVNHFGPASKALADEMAGALLRELKYET